MAVTPFEIFISENVPPGSFYLINVTRNRSEEEMQYVEVVTFDQATGKDTIVMVTGYYNPVTKQMRFISSTQIDKPINAPSLGGQKPIISGREPGLGSKHER